MENKIVGCGVLDAPKKHYFKKLLSLLLAIALLFSITAGIDLSAYAEITDESWYNYKYRILDDGTIELTYYYSSSDIVTIPSTLNGYKVSSIGYHTFYYEVCTITDIILPEGLKSIDCEAFYKCFYLKSITIPDSVTNIGQGAFYDCRDLTNVTIPDSVTSIGNYAFYNCRSLTSITIPDSVTSIGDRAFSNCLSLESATIGDRVISIGDRAFYECSNLTSVIIGNSVTCIGNSAFSSCSGLTSITIPDSVTSIGDWAFLDCRSLAKVNIPDNVTSIGEGSFKRCSSLTSVTIPNSVTKLGSDAFTETEYYNNKDNWTDGVLYIGDFLIKADSDTISNAYTIKSGTTVIADSAFERCDSLEYITMDIGIQSIGNSAFEKCSCLTSVTIPNSVKIIGISAFYDCRRLTNVSLPDSVTSIGNYAFYNCRSLTSITIPDSVTSIGDYAFHDCNFKNLTIPDSVSSIGNCAFSYYLIEVDPNNKYFSSEDGILFNKSKTKLVYYPSSLQTELYIIPNSVTSIENYAFDECTHLTNITIPDSVTSIGECAFYKTAYYNDENNWDNHVLYIGKFLIKADGDMLIGEYSIKSGTIVIADAAFKNCYYLEYITIPNSVTSIGNYAFDGCSNLTSVKIPNSVISIGDSAFKDCYNYIGYEGEWVHGQASVYYDGTINEWNEINVGKNNPIVICSDGTLNCRHNYLLSNIIQKGTCTEEEICIHTCKECNYTIKEITKISHSYNSVITQPATCTKTGIKTYTCSRCNNTKIETIEAIGHKTEIDSAVSPTCTKTGLTEGSHCYVCGEVVKEQKTVPAKGHSYDDGKVTKYPTCFEEGTIIHSCTDCGAAKIDTLAPTGHNYDKGKVTKGATCFETGVRTYTCSDCNAKKTEIIPLAEHSLIADPARIPTCSEAGLTAGSHCFVCNAVVTAQKTVPATGHSYDNGKVTKSATCTTAGVKTYICTKCGETKTETLAKTVHTYKTTTTKATATKNGKIVKKCTICGASTTTVIYSAKTITLSATSYTYDGKVKKPTVTVKDSKGKKIAASNYTVTYQSGRKNVGTYTVTIKFKGNYSGTVKKTFTIKPKATTLSSVTAKSKGFTAKWKKQATQTTGYEIQYSTDKNFKKNNKTVTVSKNKTTSKAVSKLSAKKKYYVRVRTYKTVKVNGKSTKIYSAWSKSKAVTTKK